MDRLENYLDQVCRSIGGPRALRQHVRQELGEHLRDAVARHRAAGLSPEEALDRALADFGGPDHVRSELEATHGHRLLPVLIDKAMEWKERTMRAKWLWTSWAYLAVAAVVLLEVLYLGFAVLFELPKMQKLRADGGFFQMDEASRPVLTWMFSFLQSVQWAWDRLLWWMLISASAWALFEWRVRSENKPFMRLSALGTAAVALTVVVAVFATSMLTPFVVGVPGTVRIGAPMTAHQMDVVETSVKEIEQAAAQKDWAAVELHGYVATRALDHLSALVEAIPALAAPQEGPAVEKLRARMKSAKEALQEVQQASLARDAAKLKAAIEKFRRAYGLVGKGGNKAGN